MEEFTKDVAYLPALRRERFLPQVLKSLDKPFEVKTGIVRWTNMSLVMGDGNDPVTEGRVHVNAEELSLTRYVTRMDAILNCCISAQVETVVKYNTPITTSKSEHIRLHLFDSIVSYDDETGEMVGVLRLRHRSAKHGLARLRLHPTEKPNEMNLQVVIRHHHPQGVKGLLHSVLSRVNPQFMSHSKRNLTLIQSEWRAVQRLKREVASAEALLVQMTATGDKINIETAKEMLLSVQQDLLEHRNKFDAYLKGDYRE